MFKIKKILIWAIFLSSPLSQAGISPIGLSIIPPVQLPPQTFSVTGARVSALWGKHYGVYGIDLGVLGNITTHDFAGVGVSGLFNLNQGESTSVGVQVAGLVNINLNKARIYGLQIAAGMNYNTAESSLLGLQFALINHSKYTKIAGLQLGLYNQANTITGFQIGVLNDTENLHGIQIGLLNFNRKGLFYVVPFLNIGF